MKTYVYNVIVGLGKLAKVLFIGLTLPIWFPVFALHEIGRPYTPEELERIEWEKRFGW